ncbi:uncharacterized protein LOC125823545 [Solanum verrucosum]|uniref:uncharacterized protein LOC125823545 n=1 Tax=Solanum verrucosum TaxID=315347 RepID=UPI0020D063C3|nr:uncharacterized protein LOC125823545 [Solanum verrucosum]
MVVEPRDEMSRYVIGVSSLVRKECRSAMLHDNMDISRLMVYAKQMEDEKLQERNRDVKRPRTDDRNSSKEWPYGESLPHVKGSRERGKASPLSGSNFDAPKKNRLHTLQSRSDQEGSPDVVTVMLQVFSINVYALLELGATLSFVTPFVAMKFDVLPDVLK